MPILKFTSSSGISGSFALVPELDDRNDKGYDNLIPPNSIVTIETLSDEDEANLIREANKHYDY